MNKDKVNNNLAGGTLWFGGNADNKGFKNSGGKAKGIFTEALRDSDGNGGDDGDDDGDDQHHRCKCEAFCESGRSRSWHRQGEALHGCKADGDGASGGIGKAKPSMDAWRSFHARSHKPHGHVSATT